MKTEKTSAVAKKKSGGSPKQSDASTVGKARSTAEDLRSLIVLVRNSLGPESIGNPLL